MYHDGEHFSGTEYYSGRNLSSTVWRRDSDGVLGVFRGAQEVKFVPLDGETLVYKPERVKNLFVEPIPFG